MAKTPSERFWARVDIRHRDECWRWLGATRSADPKRAYGMAWSEGRYRPATQVVWELTHVRAFPSGKMACHTCDNPLCVNPAHLFVGTMTDNLRDAVAKGRLRTDGRLKQTQCAHGHPLSGDNIYRRPSTGHRECRMCRARRQAVVHAKARLAAALEGRE